MNDDSTSNDEKDLSQEEMLERAKQLLTLTDLVDRYPAVVERRITGIIFILIGGGVSLATLFFSSLMNAFPSIGSDLFIVVVFVIGSLALSGIIVFRLIRPLTQSYSNIGSSTAEGMTLLMKATWGIIVVVIVLLTIYSFGTGQQQLFPIFIQIVLAFGNAAIYYDMRKDPQASEYSLSHLILVVLIVVSIVPIIILPSLAFTIMILIDIGGIYGLGIYILLTAERMLVQTMESD